MNRKQFFLTISASIPFVGRWFKRDSGAEPEWDEWTIEINPDELCAYDGPELEEWSATVECRASDYPIRRRLFVTYGESIPGIPADQCYETLQDALCDVDPGNCDGIYIPSTGTTYTLG